jgi:hypothetical protein
MGKCSDMDLLIQTEAVECAMTGCGSESRRDRDAAEQELEEHDVLVLLHPSALSTGSRWPWKTASRPGGGTRLEVV